MALKGRFLPALPGIRFIRQARGYALPLVLRGSAASLPTLTGIKVLRLTGLVLDTPIRDFHYWLSDLSASLTLIDW